MKNNTLEYDENQCLLTPELIQLMGWLCQYETEALKNIISRALAQGIKNTKAESYGNFASVDEMQQYFLSFISLLEILLQEATNERAIKQANHHNLLPALDKIDNKTCDESTIKSSLAMAASKLEHNPTANPKQILFEEILKRWSPDQTTHDN